MLSVGVDPLPFRHVCGQCIAIIAHNLFQFRLIVWVWHVSWIHLQKTNYLHATNFVIVNIIHQDGPESNYSVP